MLEVFLRKKYGNSYRCIRKYFQLNPLLDDVSWIGQKVIVSGWGDLDDKKPPSKPDILQYANLEIWEPNVCFLRWFDVEPDTARPSNWKEQMKKGSTVITQNLPKCILKFKMGQKI